MSPDSPPTHTHKHTHASFCPPFLPWAPLLLQSGHCLLRDTDMYFEFVQMLFWKCFVTPRDCRFFSIHRGVHYPSDKDYCLKKKIIKIRAESSHNISFRMCLCGFVCIYCVWEAYMCNIDSSADYFLLVCCEKWHLQFPRVHVDVFNLLLSFQSSKNQSCAAREAASSHLRSWNQRVFGIFAWKMKWNNKETVFIVNVFIYWFWTVVWRKKKSILKHHLRLWEAVISICQYLLAF